MKKLFVVLSLALIASQAHANSEPTMCEYYTSAKVSDYSERVKEQLLAHADTKSKVAKIVKMNNDTINRAAYALWCNSDFDNRYIFEYTFSIAPPKAWRHNQ